MADSPTIAAPAETHIYKICAEALWRGAEAAGAFAGAEIDLKDGYIHFSTAATARETAALHFAGRAGLVLLTIEVHRLPAGALRWEAARGGTLFPHLYAHLPLPAVSAVQHLPLDADGRHLFPHDFPQDVPAA